MADKGSRRAATQSQRPRRAVAGFRCPLWIWPVLGLWSGTAAASDIVVMRVGPEGRQRLERSGEVLDYTGRGLTLRTPEGRQVEIPAESVVRVEAELSAAHREGNLALETGRFDEALRRFREVRDEPRRWVRRMLGADMALALHGLGRHAEAGQMFLAVVQDDPQTPFFDRIPLAWTAGERVDAATAEAWLARQTDPAALLLGASYSLGTPRQTAGLQVLDLLAEHRDPRIAGLAEAQRFRTRFASASEEELERFARAVERTPPPYRAGGYYLLGRGRAARGGRLEAAAVLMRVPILFPRQREPAAESLLLSGRLLSEHAAQQADLSAEQRKELFRDAARLYQELLIDYADSNAAREARRRLEELQEKMDVPR